MNYKGSTYMTEERIKLAGEEKKDRLYEPKQNQKAIKVLTVAAYVLCVSLAAIMLSSYYVFLWSPSPIMKRINSTENSISNCGASDSFTSEEFPSSSNVSASRNLELLRNDTFFQRLLNCLYRIKESSSSRKKRQTDDMVYNNDDVLNIENLIEGDAVEYYVDENGEDDDSGTTQDSNDGEEISV